MPYNLIDEAWIPVRRGSGQRDWIAPWEISDRKDPPLRIETGRPDFDGALVQFLIGLMQTTAAPADNHAWRQMLKSPPHPADLRERFLSVRDAFNLDGEGPRFMQDLTLDENEPEELPVAALLIDSPGEFDHFVKRERVVRLSMAAVAAALFTLQTNAPSGGRGHRTGLRGGGPLTTLIAGERLFDLVAMNVLTRIRFEQWVPGLKGTAFPFPWTRATRTSEKDQTVDPEHADALEHYWSTPRRIRVRFIESIDGCDLYPSQSAAALTFVARSYGANYKGSFLHPLTPYVSQRDRSLAPRKGRANAFQYRDWGRVTLGTEESRTATVLMQYFEARPADAKRIEIFGFDMDNAKAVAFRSTSTVLLGADLNDDNRGRLATEAEYRGKAASHVLRSLLKQLRRAWEGEHSDDRGSMDQFEQEFWASTESDFFSSISASVESIADGDRLVALREGWVSTLHRAAMKLFDRHAGLLGVTTDVTLRNIAIARRDLLRFTHPNGKVLRTEVGLAPLTQTAHPRSKKGPKK